MSSEPESSKPVTIWLTEEEREACDVAKVEAGVSRSGLIRTFIAERLGLAPPNIHSPSPRSD